jgi:hypothetical protein
VLRIVPKADTEPRGLCCYDGPCTRNGLAVYGPPRLLESGCINRTIRCLKCGVTGEESQASVQPVARGVC